MTIHLDTVVAGGFGGAWTAKAGMVITVVDLEGEQAGDFVAFCAATAPEAMSPPHCREALLTLFVTKGATLVTTKRRPILRIVADDVGVHDATIPACDPTRYAVEFGVPGHRNCLDNLHAALAPWSIDALQIPEPLNLFQNTPVVGDGRIGLTDPISRPGSRVAFRALEDVYGALSVCPQDIIPGNGLRPSPMRIIVSDEPGEA